MTTITAAAAAAVNTSHATPAPVAVASVAVAEAAWARAAGVEAGEGRGQSPGSRAATARPPATGARVSACWRVWSRRQTLAGRELTGEQRREVRAVRLVEQAGTPEVRKLLEALSKASPSWWVIQEVKAALQRLHRRDKKP